MATYNSTYKYNPPRRKKQRYALVERVVDFSKKPNASISGNPIETAWAAGDVLEAIQIRAGQTVLGVTFELMAVADVANTVIKVGYGTDADFWGTYDADAKNKIKRSDDGITGGHVDQRRNFWNPLYFSSADTIDLTINQAITAGKVRVIVHLLEDDR